MTSYSISIRLQRTTVEEAYVFVPVTGAVMGAEPEDGGYRHLDPDKLLAAAIALGEAPDARWLPERREVEPHPVQQAPPGAEFPQ
ncbi:hypothetical protein [Kitasatospora sp. NPDC101183]|uniref:hypothetical protein n=1 Tax=Kitasatospora sp. NPDC101183 TaxID=3364100 RepID=UPI0038095C2B